MSSDDRTKVDAFMDLHAFLDKSASDMKKCSFERVLDENLRETKMYSFLQREYCNHIPLFIYNDWLYILARGYTQSYSLRMHATNLSASDCGNIMKWASDFEENFYAVCSAQCETKVCDNAFLRAETDQLFFLYTLRINILKTCCGFFDASLSYTDIDFDRMLEKFRNSDSKYTHQLFSYDIDVCFAKHLKLKSIHINDLVTRYLTEIRVDYKNVCKIHGGRIEKDDDEAYGYNERNILKDTNNEYKISSDHRSCKYLVDKLIREETNDNTTALERILGSIVEENTFVFKDNHIKLRKEIIKKYELGNYKRIWRRLFLKILFLVIGIGGLIASYLLKDSRGNPEYLTLTIGLLAAGVVLINEMMVCCRDIRELYKSKLNITRYEACYECISRKCGDKRKDFEEEKRECSFQIAEG